MRSAQYTRISRFLEAQQQQYLQCGASQRQSDIADGYFVRVHHSKTTRKHLNMPHVKRAAASKCVGEANPSFRSHVKTNARRQQNSAAAITNSTH